MKLGKVDIVLLFVAATLIIAGLSIFPWWTVDDAYISYRYGKNLAESGQLDWNPGNGRVEGYTGILLPLLSSFAIFLGIDPVLFIKILSILALLAIVWVMLGATRKMGISSRVSLLIITLYLTNPSIYLHTLSGLETSIFSFLILASLISMYPILEGEDAKSRDILIFSSLILLSVFTRPEGALLYVLCIGTLVFLRKIHFLFHWLSAVFIPIIILIIYAVWKYSYYGHLIPNTAYAKSFDSGLINVESILEFGRFFRAYLSVPVMGAMLAWILSGIVFKSNTSLIKGSNFRYFIIISTLFILGCLMVYLRSHLYMNYWHRFFIPFIPVFLLIVAFIFDRLLINSKTLANPISGKTGIFFMIFLGASQTAVHGFMLKEELWYVNYYKSIMEEELIGASDFVRSRLPEGSTVISYMDAGALGYFSGMNIIDFGRLNDPYLARDKPDSNAVADYFFNQNAEAIIMTSENDDFYEYNRESAMLQRDNRFKRYKKVKILGNSAGFPYFQYIYMREDLVTEK